MAIVRRNLWIGALLFGVALLGLGALFVVKGFDTKAMIRAELAAENVTVSADAEKFGFIEKAGVPVTDAKSAQAQANTIEKHSVDLKGTVLKSGQDTTLYYAQMGRDLFVTPEAYTNARNTYLNGLNLRNALNMAAMGFGVADMAIGTGAVIILLGLATVGIGVPALYWARQAEGQVVREVSRRLAPARATAAQGLAGGLGILP